MIFLSQPLCRPLNHTHFSILLQPHPLLHPVTTTCITSSHYNHSHLSILSQPHSHLNLITTTLTSPSITTTPTSPSHHNHPHLSIPSQPHFSIKMKKVVVSMLYCFTNTNSFNKNMINFVMNEISFHEKAVTHCLLNQ